MDRDDLEGGFFELDAIGTIGMVVDDDPFGAGRKRNAFSVDRGRESHAAVFSEPGAR